MPYTKKEKKRAIREQDKEIKKTDPKVGRAKLPNRSSKR